MTLSEWLGLAVSTVSLGFVVVRWLLSIIDKSISETASKIAKLEGEIRGMIMSERENADRVYAREADMAVVRTKIDAIETTLRDVHDTVHKVYDALSQSRK